MEERTHKDLYNALVAFHKPPEEEKIDIGKLKFVMYARKSTRSNERQERSISDQKLDCFDAAKRLGIPENHITVVQEQESAKEPDIRPHFKQMIEDIKRGKYDAILAWHPDRLARNMADAGRVIDLLDKKIIKNLSFATFSFEDTPMGKMLLGISFVLSKQYSDHLSEAVTRGQRRTLAEGKYIHTAKHGYYKDPNSYLRPDGENWILIKQAFHMRAEGKTQEEIADFLNKSRYTRAPSLEGKPRKPYFMTVQKVSVMLRDPTYAGVLLYGESIVDLVETYDFEAVISVETFMAINELSNMGSAFKMVKPMKKRQATKADFLRGMVSCSFCQKPMSSGIVGKKNKSKGTTGIYYYRCETKGCERPKKSLRARVVMQFVLDFLETHLFATRSNYEAFCRTMKEESVQHRQELESRFLSLQRARTENEKTKERVKAVLLKNDETMIEYFKGDMAKVKKDAEEIAEEMQKTEEQIAKAKDAPMTYETFLELFMNTAKTLHESEDLAYRDRTIRLLFSNFVVDNEKVANCSLQLPFSDFFKQGDFLDGRAGGT
ncbi:recombinase family protein [Candidatus Uhrbacteria bacterium]|nr:recombinase family protein [Candidatus Uhrbacteria bacterium]